MKKFAGQIAIVLAACLSGCITSPGPGGAPRPVPRVDKARLNNGDWHEIVYRPYWVTDGCVAGQTRHTPRDKPNEVGVRDSCREKAVDAMEKAVEGTGHILDPGTNAKIWVDSFPFASCETQIGDLAPDYGWYITSTPDCGAVNFFARDPQLAPELVAELTAKVNAMGFDASLLLFPPQPPR